MKILVVPRFWIENMLKEEQDFLLLGSFISIFSSTIKEGKPFSPLPDKENILKLQFDDVTDSLDKNTIAKLNLVLFNEDHANQIKQFVKTINTDEMLFIHCDAGISRSGAVGDVLNDFFNKFLETNTEDFNWFKKRNSHIMPNPLVNRILRNVMFGTPSF